MRAALRIWVAFWDRREAPHSLALTRILVGAAVLGDLLQAGYLDLVPDIWAAPPLGLGYGAASSSSGRWFGASRETAFGVWLATVVSCACLMTGTFTRTAGIALALCSAELSRVSPSADRGIDDLMRIAAVVLACSGAGARWSVDAWIRKLTGRAAPERIPAWPRYLLFAQLLWVYSSAAQHRADVDWWPSGGLSALGKILSDPHYSRVPSGYLEPVYPLTQLGTLGTMIFELSAPLMLLWTWYERTPRWPGTLRRAALLLRVRWLWMATGVFFHFGIALTMRLGMFPFGMLALYPVLLHPGELSGFLQRIRAAFLSRRAEKPAGP